MEIERVALLARLNLSDNEKEVFSKQVGSIIDYIDKLNELDTSQVEPTAHIFPLKNVFREDILRPSLPVGMALKNAPGGNDEFYRVPKIIE